MSAPQITKGTWVQVGSDGLLAGPGGTPANGNVIQQTSPTGQILRLTMAPPTVGTEWTVTMPASASAASVWGVSGASSGLWVRILLAFQTLQTNATVANRFPGYQILDNLGVAVMKMITTVQQPANILGKIERTRSCTNQSSFGGDGIQTMKFDQQGIVLAPGFQLQSVTTNLQTGIGGDQYSGIEFMLEVWTSEPIYDGLGPSYS